MGNQFLARVRDVDAVMHVVRTFEEENVSQVEGRLDPIRDIGNCRNGTSDPRYGISRKTYTKTKKTAGI